MATEFTDDKSSVLRSLLTGFREKKSYADIRKDLKVFPEYKAGIGDTYVFPDESAYQTQIRDRMSSDARLRLRVRK